MSPIVQIGKAGVTEAFLKQVTQALADHELLKVKIGAECPLDRHEVAARLDREPGINIVQMVGRVLLLYKRHPHAPRYEGKQGPAAKRLSAATEPVGPRAKRAKRSKRTDRSKGPRPPKGKAATRGRSRAHRAQR